MSGTTLLRLPEVMKTTGKPRSSIYDDMRNKSFPLPVKLGKRTIAWRKDEIQDWIDSRPRVAVI